MAPTDQRCCPETMVTLRAQQLQLTRGERSVQMFPVGTPELPLPSGMSRISLTSGIFHYNPELIDDDEIRDAVDQQRENDILGLGPYSKQDLSRLGPYLACVVERDPSGTELRSALGTLDTVPDQRAYMEARKSPGSTVSYETWQNVLMKRYFDGQGH